jgi:hypothetical protein
MNGKSITVGELRTIIAEMDSSTPVVITGSDHSYMNVYNASKEDAEIDLKTREMWEYYDDESKCKKSNRVIEVLVIE